MRDQWYRQLPIGWYKLSLEERGLLGTLHSQGEHCRAMWSDVDTLFGQSWKMVADGLVVKRCIELAVRNGEVEMSLKLKTAKRRAYMRNYRRVSK